MDKVHLTRFRDNAYLLRLFFQDPDAWRKAAPCYGLRSSISLQDYEDLFKGTDADLYIPLWASACKEKGEILIDRCTYECICFYKKWGYRALCMDGNPPDYIGEQLRFLEYLSALAAQGEEEAARAIDDFIDEYTLDTVKVLCQHIREQDRIKVGEELRFVMDALMALVSEEALPPPREEELHSLSFATEALRALPWEDLQRREALPIEEPHVVRSAGINNCGGNCKLEVWTAEGCILDISADTSMNGMQIRTCPRGRAYRQTFLNARRLRYPMVRRGKRGEGKFRRISYEEAAKTIASKMKESLELYGPESRHILYGTGICAVARPEAFLRRLLNMQGGHLERYGSYSSAQTNIVTPYVLGDMRSAGHPADVLNAGLILLWGHNTAETIIGPFRNYYLAQAKEKGIPIIVIDPRQSETALSFATEWIPLKPGSDCALANAMAYVIFREGLQDQDFIDRFCLGMDESQLPEGAEAGESYRAYLFGEQDGIVKDPAWGEKISGVPAVTIERLARMYACAKPACLLPGLGLQRTFLGENAIRATIALAAMTGNIGKKGGGASGTVTPRGHYEAPYVEWGENPCKTSIPVFLWSKAIDRWEEMTGKEDGIRGAEQLSSGIKLLFSLASNTLINQHADINDTLRILSDEEKCETIVLSDLFYTPSARWADILLPGASLFETEHMPTTWASDDYALYGNPCRTPLFGGTDEYEWIKRVAKELGLYEDFVEGCPEKRDWHRRIYEEKLRPMEPEVPDFERFMEEGGYVYSGPCKDALPFQKQVEEGEAFATPSGKIEIYSEKLRDKEDPRLGAIPRWYDGVEGPTDREGKSRYPLQLIGYHTKRRCHSIHDQNPLLEELDAPALWIHPADAATRGIGEGEMVEVFNDRGRVHIPAKVTDRMMQGCIAMAQGAWYTPDEEGTDLRGSINVLTDASHPSALAKGSTQHSNLAEVRKLDGE